MTVWFTADTHFGHGGALGLFRRPFDSVAAMDEAMIARWNERVAPADEVWHLGDFAVLGTRAAREERAAELLGRLNGTKRLIAGNNDDASRALPAWAEVADYVETTVEDVPLVPCHYALRSWRGQHKGWWNLHGHSHGALEPLARQRDVGVDLHDFAPTRLGDLRARTTRPRRSSARARAGLRDPGGT